MTDGTILDCGARQGSFNNVFRELKYEKIIAADLDTQALEVNTADKKVSLDLEEKLPFPEEFCDCVFAAEIIEHLENRREFLMELFRVLKPSGNLLLTTPNKRSLIAYFDRLIGRFIENGKWNGHDFNHRYVYAFDEIRDLLRKVGFKIVASESFYLFYGLPIRTKTSLGMCTWIMARK
ncbi:MAG: methyltransferase domain-containing protein [Nitrospirota bacterium]